MEDKNIQKELQKLAPLLDATKKEFRQIPKDYFENLNKIILSQTTNNQKVTTKKYSISLISKIAASLAILFGIGLGLSYFSHPKPSSLTSSNQEEALDYIEENLSDFSEEEIESILDMNDLEGFLLDDEDL